MRIIWLSVSWLLSLVTVYCVGWFNGVKSAANVAAGTTHFMGATIEYLLLALIAVSVVGAGIFIFSRQKPVEVVNH